MLISENFLLYTPFFLVLWEQISHPEKKNKTCVCDKGLDVIYQVCCDFSILWKVPVTKWMNACVSYCCPCRAASAVLISPQRQVTCLLAVPRPHCVESLWLLWWRELYCDIVLWSFVECICWCERIAFKGSIFVDAKGNIWREHIPWCKGKQSTGTVVFHVRRKLF